MSTLLNIAIAEPSAIIRSGLEAVLKRLPGFRIQIIEIATAELLQETLRSHKPDMLIINPSLPGCYTMQLLREETGCSSPHTPLLRTGATSPGNCRYTVPVV